MPSFLQLLIPIAVGAICHGCALAPSLIAPSGRPPPHVFGQWTGVIRHITVYDKEGNAYVAMGLDKMQGPSLPDDPTSHLTEAGVEYLKSHPQPLPLLVTARGEIINAPLLPQGEQVVIDGVIIGAGESVVAPVIGSAVVQLARKAPPPRERHPERVVKVRQVVRVNADGKRTLVWKYMKAFENL